MPAITFQAAPPPLQEKLPRMDVAAFVGFASSGPLHTPVAVEDQVRFREIFGPDLALAWDEEAGTPHRAWLGPAVEAFFRNGGRRCWVVRVAGDGARANRFAVPGLVRVSAEGKHSPARLQARSEGAWSDSLRVGGTLLTSPLGEVALLESGAIGVRRSVRTSLRPGDLLQVQFRESGLLLFLAAEQVEEAGAQWLVRGRECWFLKDSPPVSTEEPIQVRELRPTPEPPRPMQAYWAEPGKLYMRPDEAPRPGALLQIDLEDGGQGLMSVSQVRPASRAELGDWAESPPMEMVAVIGAQAPLYPIPTATGRELAGGRATADRLSLELWVVDGEGPAAHLSQMGFAPKHDRYLGYLPTDARLYGPEEERSADGDRPGAHLERLAAEPRFPLASLDPGGLYLPIGLPLLPQREQMSGPDLTGESREARNGLASFDPILFLDPDLAHQSAEALPGAIFQKRYAEGRPLKGIHALWPLEEVTLFALPDAVHPPWERAEPPAVRLLLAPELLPIENDLIRWSEVEGATGYLLQEASDPQFTTILRAVTTDLTEATLESESNCSTFRYFRVRALENGLPGPWSNTVRTLHPPQSFKACDDPFLPAPWLVGQRLEEEGGFDLHWRPVGEGDAVYTLQQSPSPDLEGAPILYQGPFTATTVAGLGGRPTYFRVRARVDGQLSPWSNTVVLFEQRAMPAWRLDRTAQASELDQRLLPLHRAALRFARARGDLFAVLTLPAGHREGEAVAYARALTGGLRATDPKALSYGALYHPWLQTGGGDGLRLLPPDGAITGLIASRAADRGAWVAPANSPLADVLALTPTIRPELGELLEAEQVNLIRRAPRGFLTLSAETLSPEADLQPIGVLRLLILLRRLALREGQSLVFAPNDEQLRSLVQRQFESLLTDLYRRGAFAGDTPESSFQVVADSSVNPRESVEQGRLIVELRVAPSQPLMFLMVRLVQADTGAAVLEV